MLFRGKLQFKVSAQGPSRSRLHISFIFLERVLIYLNNLSRGHWYLSGVIFLENDCNNNLNMGKIIFFIFQTKLYCYRLYTIFIDTGNLGDYQISNFLIYQCKHLIRLVTLNHQLNFYALILKFMFIFLTDFCKKMRLSIRLYFLLTDFRKKKR